MSILSEALRGDKSKLLMAIIKFHGVVSSIIIAK